MGPFIILLLLQQEIIESSAQYYCALQDRTMRVTEGGSVTSRCTLSYPERDDYTALLIQWYDSEYGNCYTGYNIYNLTMISTHDKYKGRISIMTNPVGNKSESIEIWEVKRKDGPVICCSVNVTYILNAPYYFSTLYGTQLLFDDQVWVDQLEAVTALTGDNITISCHINFPAGRNVTVQQVTWKMGEACHIANDILVIFPSEVRGSTERFSVVDFPNDVSLHINNIQMNDGQTYCCLVKINEEEFSTKHGTELVITELRRNSEFTVNQPEESSTTVGGSANITCSYNTPINKTTMDAVIYWRAGSHDGPIAYHPSTWMVHPTYRGRTNVTRKTDLQIMGVQHTENSVYYCFVTLKFCVGNGVINNSISYGNGTRLIVIEEKTSQTPLVTSTKSGPPMHTTSLKVLCSQGGGAWELWWEITGRRQSRRRCWEAMTCAAHGLRCGLRMSGGLCGIAGGNRRGSATMAPAPVRAGGPLWMLWGELTDITSVFGGCEGPPSTPIRPGVSGGNLASSCSALPGARDVVQCQAGQEAVCRAIVAGPQQEGHKDRSQVTGTCLSASELLTGWNAHLKIACQRVRRDSAGAGSPL
ncbi:sialic acid-binding Ig-like lectin 14 [Pelobates cultripes]|uniref:Natural cytotoxicity triggering receptor 3 n=1 Tax=Pelobates cultripes TaxID=61616 RepID=A0AAD1RIW3_PELCU|nr:sialic acid-binding Ig-like lectin 14 [Pelobates cultripes]